MWCGLRLLDLDVDPREESLLLLAGEYAHGAAPCVPFRHAMLGLMPNEGIFRGSDVARLEGECAS